MLVNDHPDTIHDARVWSRRLQEALRVFSLNRESAKAAVSYPAPGPSSSERLQKRRCDSGFDRGQIQFATASTLDASWELIRNYLLEKRTRQAARAGEELTRHDITRFVTRTEPASGEWVEKEPETLLKQSIEEALAVWNEALRNAQENPQVDQIHALRIAGKRLRYRTELLKELGHASVEARIKALKLLQDELGNWHDRHVLLQFIAEFIGRPRFPRRPPRDRACFACRNGTRATSKRHCGKLHTEERRENADVWGRSKSGVVEK